MKMIEKWKVQFIFSFRSTEQQMLDIELPCCDFYSRKTLLRRIRTLMDKSEYDDLYFISTCIFGKFPIDLIPKWYTQCNGKIALNH